MDKVYIIIKSQKRQSNDEWVEGTYNICFRDRADAEKEVESLKGLYTDLVIEFKIIEAEVR